MNKMYFPRAAAILGLFFCTLLLLLGCSRSDSDSDLPARPQNLYVYDEAGILKSDTKQYIAAENETLYPLTGTQVAVACVRSTGEETISAYARDLFLAWEIGSSEGKTGVLLVLCPREDGYWCLQSRELENTLPDETIARILQQSLEPHFLAGNYDEGVRAVFDELLLSLTPASSPETENSADPDDPAPRRESSSHILGWAVIVVLILLLVLHFVLVSEKTPRRQKRRTIYSSPRPRRLPPGARPNPVRRPNAPRPPANRPSRPTPPQSHGSRPSGHSAGTRRH